MFPYLVGAAVIGGVVLALLDSETRSQHERFQRKERQLRHESSVQRAKIQAAMQHSADYQNYKKYIAMHYASVQTAGQAFELYTSAKHVLDQLYAQLRISSEQIKSLKQQRQALKGSERELTHQNLQQQYIIHSQLKQAIQDYKAQKASHYQEMKKLNKATADLKEYIQHNTGKVGREWYDRLQQRRLGA